MTETEVAISGSGSGAGGDTEIDLYADVVETELDTVCNGTVFNTKKKCF